MLYCTQYATGPYEWCLYGCGNSLLIPRFWFDVIAKNNVAKYKQSNYTVNPSGDVYYKIDDNAIGLVVNSYALVNKIDMYDVWMNFEFPPYGEPVIEPHNFLVIPFREYTPDNSRDLEEPKSRIIHTIVENTESTKDVNDILKHQEVHIIDFNKKMDSVVTRELADKFMTCLSLPKYIKNLAINNKRYNTLS